MMSACSLTKQFNLASSIDSKCRIKHVTLVVHSGSVLSNNQAASGGEWFQLSFGLVLTYFRPKSDHSLSMSSPKTPCHKKTAIPCVIIRDIIPGSPADKSGKINRGDILLYVDGHEVTLSSMKGINRSQKMEAHLTLRIPVFNGDRFSSLGHLSFDSYPWYKSLPMFVTGCTMFSLNQRLLQIRCAALYLTFSSSLEENTYNVEVNLATLTSSRYYQAWSIALSILEDVVYSFPPLEQPLTAIRGIFLTLSSSIPDIVQARPVSSSLLIDDVLVNVVYHYCGEDVFILAAPDTRVILPALDEAASTVCKMLTLTYGAVDRAFYSMDICQLDQVFALLFHRTLHLPYGGEDGGNDGSVVEDRKVDYRRRCELRVPTSLPVLSLSNENKQICDEILSEFESMDFDDFIVSVNQTNYLAIFIYGGLNVSFAVNIQQFGQFLPYRWMAEDSELYSRRPYMIVGSALFFKDLLVCSHLSDTDLANIHCFLRCHGVLDLAAKQYMDKLLVWKELQYPACGKHFPAERCQLVYSRAPCRRILLVVGMKNFMLASMLEAGVNCQGVHQLSEPQSLLVDQARDTLMQLDTDSEQMSAFCEDSLSKVCESSHTINVDCFLNKETCNVEHVRGSMDMVETGIDQKLMYGGDGTDGEDGRSFGQGANMSHRRHGKDVLCSGGKHRASCRQGTATVKHKPSHFTSLIDISTIGRCLSNMAIEAVDVPERQRSKVTRGAENVLFSYIYCNGDKGVYVSPLDSYTRFSSGHLHWRVMSNFYRCVQNMQAMFQWDDSEAIRTAGRHGWFGDSCVAPGFVEHGLRFQCEFGSSPAHPDSTAACFGYWVVGRRMKLDSGTMFVCIHDSSCQNVVELAFKLGFGN